MIARDAVVKEAREWLGTPFAHGQMLKGVGCDCIGLVAGVAVALGLPEGERWRTDTRYRGYARLPNPEKLLQACAEYLDEIPVSRAQPGDVLQYTFAKDPMHFAIMTQASPSYVIHAYERARWVVENGARATFWKLQRAFRFRGVA